MILVRFFGKYREQLGKSQLELDVSGDFATLSRALVAAEPALAEILTDPCTLFAVNQHLRSRQKLAAVNGDELAIMPPVTGG